MQSGETLTNYIKFFLTMQQREIFFLILGNKPTKRRKMRGNSKINESFFNQIISKVLKSLAYRELFLNKFTKNSI